MTDVAIDAGSPKAPWHLWPVGVLALLWNAAGAYTIMTAQAGRLAGVAPDEAADWALATRTDERRGVVEAVMQGAARNPPEAVRVALRLCASDPERGGDYGHYTIGALVDRGAFDSALKFGLEVGPNKYPFLLKSASFQWARNQPAAALAALETIPDPIMRGLASGEAHAGWAWADAKGHSE